MLSSQAVLPGISKQSRLISASSAALFLVVSLGPAGTRAQPAARTAAPSGAINRALIDRYCVSCHNERLKTAGLALDRADLTNLAQDRPTWEKVVRKLRSGAMPPRNVYAR